MNNFKYIMNYKFWRGLFLVFLFVLLISPFKIFAESVITFPDNIDTTQERINLQVVLNKVITPSPNLVTDGVLGRKSIQALQVFQALKGLVSDGKPGPITRLALENAQVTLVSGCRPGDLFNSTTGQPCVTNQTPSTPLIYTPELNLETLEEEVAPPVQTNTNTNTNNSYLSINLTSPLNNAILNNNNVSLNFTTTGSPVYCWYDLGGLRVEDGAIGDPSNTQYQYPLENCQNKTITLPNRDYVLNIWGRDASGGVVFNSTWFNVVTAANDAIPPTVTSFGIPPTATTLTVPVAPFTATDNIAVTGRLLTETSTTPSPSSNSWATTTPTSYTFSSPGNKTLYAWARDAAGNVSNSLNDSVTITLNQTNEDTIYIDPTYSGTNGAENGTIERPYNSWRDFTFQSDTTYLQKKGTTYASSLQIGISNVNDVTIGSYGSGSRPLIAYSGTGYAVQTNNSDNILIDGFEIEASGSPSIENVAGIYLGPGIYNNAVNNCVIHDVNMGISGRDSDLIKISNSEIYDTERDGIYLAGITNAEVSYTNLHNLNLRWFDFPGNDQLSNGDGIQFDGNSDGFHFHHNILDRSATGNKFGLMVGNLNHPNVQGIIEYNTFMSPVNNYSIALYRGNGIHVRYNSFNGPFRSVRVMSPASNIQIYGNTFRNDTEVGIALVSSTPNANIYNNSFYNVDEHIFNGGVGTKIKNNIFHITATGDVALTGSSTADISNNCFSTAPTRGTNPIVGNPLFVNASAGDFHLQSGSPCINAGTNVGLTEDRDGTSIPQGSAPDIGAYESTTVLGVSTYHFTGKLELGSKGNEVVELQKILISKGYLQGNPDGDFGPYTFEAVKAYQNANSLEADGVVGLKTREMLNK